MVRALAALAWLWLAWLAPAGACGADDATREREWRHVRAVLFGALDDSTYYAGRVNRWETTPVLALFGAGPVDRAFVAEAVAGFNRVLAARAVRVAEEDERAEATIGLFFASRDEVQSLVVRHGLRRRLAMLGAGYAEMRIGARHELRRAIVLIRDELEGRERRATVIHELYHALGPGGHSPWVPASVVFGDGAMSSFATAMAPVDVKTLALLYRHLRSGDDEAAVRGAFDAHWPSLASFVGASE